MLFMEKPVSFIFFLLITISLFSQNNIPNSSFEEWTTNGLSPKGWGTMDKWIGENIFSTKKETVDVVNGSAALRLKTVSFQGQTLPGLVILGEYNPFNAGGIFGIPFSGRPDTLHVIYKYKAQNDTAVFAIRLTGFGTKSETIMSVIGRVPGDDIWIYLSLPLQNFYISPNEPDSVTIAITTSANEQIAKIGSTLIVDGLYFSYKGSVSTYGGMAVKQLTGKLFPSVVNDQLNFSSEEVISGSKWLIFDSNGVLKLSGKCDENFITDVSLLHSGMHNFIILDIKGNQIYRNKFVKN